MCEKKSTAIITANFEPLKILYSKAEQPWHASLDEINNGNYDLEGLNKIIGDIDIDIANFSMLVSGDSTLILPRIKEFSDLNVALNKFNEIISYLFLGGEYCEAIWPENIGFGFIDTNGQSMICSVLGGVGSFHMYLKTGYLSKLECHKIISPYTVSIETIIEKIQIGRKICKTIKNIPSEQILFGSTFFVRRQYSEALIHFWTSIERLLEITWDEYIVSPEKKAGNWKQRKASLTDNRTWTAATKLELLYQKDILSGSFRTNLDGIRRARNNLAHNGTVPTESQVKMALQCLFQYLSLIQSSYKEDDHFNHLIKMIEINAQHKKSIFNVTQTVDQKEWFKQSSNGEFLLTPVKHQD